MAAATDWAPVIPGYEIEKRIGAGGMSHVWKARDLRTGRTVAIKFLSREFAANAEDIKRFQDEERTLEAFDHPGIVKGYELGFACGSWYYSMEYIDGYDFSALLNRKQHLGESDCLLICESVASALDYAWNEFGVVHCDIKPDNILINTQGTVKLADLGLCRILGRAAAMQNGAGGEPLPQYITGTPDYMSPEQIYGDTELDCRADVYSLAATLYKLATGRFLFPDPDPDAKLRSHCSDEAQAKDPRAFRPALSDGFCRLLEAMLVKDRDGRIGSWAAVYEMCSHIEKGLSFQPRTEGGASSMKLEA